MKKKKSQQTSTPTELKRHSDGSFILPSVVDVHDFDAHAWLDVIQLKGDQFRDNAVLILDGSSFRVVKKLKDYPIQTEMPIEDRLSVRKVRYFCDKI